MSKLDIAFKVLKEVGMEPTIDLEDHIWISRKAGRYCPITISTILNEHQIEHLIWTGYDKHKIYIYQ